MEDIIKQAKSEYIDRQHSGDGDIYLSMHESDLDKIAKQILQAIVDREEKNKRNLPKDPLDITPREQIAQLVYPVYRPYKSNEESYNDGLQDTIDYLNNEIKSL